MLKGLYGLEQASRLWNKVLISAFNDAGLSLCASESGVLHCKSEAGLCLVNIHVDDYNIATLDEDLRTKIEKVMESLFSVTKLGELQLYLGIVIEDTILSDGRRSIKMHQGPYHERLLTKTNYTKAKPAKTPADPSVKLSILDCPAEDEQQPTWPYMSVGGSLMYSSICTRPDFYPRVIQLSRYNRNPGDTHVQGQKQILRYLKGTHDRGIHFTEPECKTNDKVDIIAFVDSDWAGCPDTRRSTIGFVVHLCGGPVAWKSDLKKTLALSSCEAEFMGLTDVAREVIWLCRFLDEIGVEYNIPKIYCDSASAIKWAEDPVQHQRNKHVELKYYYIRDAVAQNLVEVWKINTIHNVSDIMTKGATKNMAETLFPPLMGETEPILEE